MSDVDTNNIVKIVAQTGLAGICVLLIMAGYNLASNYISANTNAIIGVEKAITNNTAIIEEFIRLNK